LAEHLFLLNFLILAARPIRGEGRLSAASENGGTALLVSGHHRMLVYELQQTVTILQQVIAPQEASAVGARGPMTPQGRQAENHLNFRIAEGLCNRWRFFTTYVGV